MEDADEPVLEATQTLDPNHNGIDRRGASAHRSRPRQFGQTSRPS